MRPGGVIAVWTYGLVRVDPGVDRLLDAFYKEEVGSFWPPERVLVDTGYSGIAFPFLETTPPLFEMSAEWTLGHLGGYLETWSAVMPYRRATGRSPVGEFLESVRPHWGDPDQVRTVSWPLGLRVGRVS